MNKININKKQTLLYTLALLLLWNVGYVANAQSATKSSDAAQRWSAYEWRQDKFNNQLASHWKAESIGPTIMNGRITDIDVNPENAHEFYIAYASGGLWYTNNNGTSFTPVFDHEAVMTIGDIAVHWASNTLYVGTGESNSSRSSYAGNGVYKSTDGGKNWQHLGLSDSHHIGRMWVDPLNPERLMVAALGHLYTKNKERGIFITHDAGKNWEQSLIIDDSTGVVDLIADPLDKNTFYCASWHRQRSAWNFTGAGISSAIYKSTDGGKTWNDISKTDSGFPRSQYTGRIGISASQKAGQTVLYAIVDNQQPKTKQNDEKDDLTAEKIRAMSLDSFITLSDERIDQYLKNHSFPEKYNSKEIKKQLKKGKIEVRALADYLEDANASLFDADFSGAEVYKSVDGGVTWKKTHTEALTGLFFTYGYYFGQIVAQIDNADVLYILGVPLLKSEDGGTTWKDISGNNQHGDHHVLHIHPRNARLLYNGNDGGLNISYDGGTTWVKCTMPAVGQFYAVQTDDDDPYNVYGGLQDNGVWMGSSSYKYNTSWQSTGSYPYKSLLGGDGMQVQVDIRDNQTIYTGYQFGNYFRIDKKSGDRTYITPRHELGERPYRWNWQSPILISRHQPDIVYFGCNKLLRSFDKGNEFKIISGDLTHGGKKGNVPFGTLTALDESPLVFGLIYTGSDDGKICMTKDGGLTWDTISQNLPVALWVSRIVASRHSKSRVYVCLNGYRNDDFTPYVFRSDDFGKHWTSIGDGLPHEAVNVIREDLEEENLLYAGTDHGLYFTIDGGQLYQRLNHDLPNVAIHDLALQQKGKEMVIGTHGRSLYKMNIADLRKLKEWKDSSLVIGSVASIAIHNLWGKKSNFSQEVRQPEISFTIFSQLATKAAVSVRPENGDTRFTTELNIPQGISKINFPFWFDSPATLIAASATKKKDKSKTAPKAEKTSPAEDGKYYPGAGKYVLSILAGQKEVTSTFTIEARKK